MANNYSCKKSIIVRLICNNKSASGSALEKAGFKIVHQRGDHIYLTSCKNKDKLYKNSF